ncbi:MAG: dTDP-4-dehydrorhamnose reductase [bacterium]
MSGASRPERHLIIGAGQVGTALSKSLSALLNPVRLLVHSEYDLREPAKLESILDSEDFDRVWLTAAITNVDWCEEHPDEAFAVNAVAPGEIARICSDRGLSLVHFSTDYVFDGLSNGKTRNKPYIESDATNPLNEYGRAKLQGEKLVAAGHPSASIVRTSAVYAPAGTNFFKAILGKFHEMGSVEVVSEQFVSLTYAPHLADWLAAFHKQLPQGIFHVAGSGAASWFEIARAAFGLLGLPESGVLPTGAGIPDRPARRPAYSVLGSEVLPAFSFPFLPSWLEGLSSWAAESKLMGNS